MPKGFPELVVREVELQPASDLPANQAAQEGSVQVPEGSEREYNMFCGKFHFRL